MAGVYGDTLSLLSGVWAVLHGHINKEARNPGIGLEVREGRAMALEHEELTGEIIGAAIEVHRTLGPGFLESGSWFPGFLIGIPSSRQVLALSSAEPAPPEKPPLRRHHQRTLRSIRRPRHPILSGESTSQGGSMRILSFRRDFSA